MWKDSCESSELSLEEFENPGGGSVPATQAGVREVAVPESRERRCRRLVPVPNKLLSLNNSYEVGQKQKTASGD